jgi:hypothetical protein
MQTEVVLSDTNSTLHSVNTDKLTDNTETQIVKLQLGGSSVDGGLVSTDNPIPTNDKTMTDIYNIMAYFLDRLEFGMITDPAKQLYVNLAKSGGLVSVGTVSTVVSTTTVGTLSNQARIGDVQAQRMVEAQMDTAFNTGILNNIKYV